MNTLGSLFGWMAIGEAASLAAMAWPFLRGGAGVILKLLVGPLGAVAGAVLSHFVLPRASPTGRLFFAAAGALAALAAAQAVWAWYARSKSIAVHPR